MDKPANVADIGYYVNYALAREVARSRFPQQSLPAKRHYKMTQLSRDWIPNFAFKIAHAAHPLLHVLLPV